MRKEYGIAVVVLAAAALVLLAGCLAGDAGGAEKTAPGKPAETVTVAWSPFESTALFWIADEKGFFARNGIALDLKRYDSGVAALDSVVNGEADLCVGTTEFPLVGRAFQGAPVRALGTIDRGEFIYLVADGDRIGNASGLRGKTIGTTRGTIAEFHLGRYLRLHGMDLKDVVLADVRTPAGWVNDVADRKLDAIATAQPYANGARDRLGNAALVLPIQSSQPLFALVISRDDWISAHPETTQRFLASLAEAEEYATTHPQESREILRKRLDLDPSYLDTVWKQNKFSLTLDQSLVLAMEDEARWMIANNLTHATAVPDFRRHISPDALDRVKPGSVNIIR
jgi:NitT/TauT family transport system substrate-binding protein